MSKTYNVNGIPMYFDFSVFKKEFDIYCTENSTTIENVCIDFTEKLHCGEGNIKRWRLGRNSPASIEMVKDLAQALSLSDYTLLLKEETRGSNMNMLTEKQIDAVKRITDAFIAFLNDFYHSDGFNDLWYPLHDAGKDADNEIYVIVDAKKYNIELALDQEYFYLHDTEIYDELYDFYYNELDKIYDGKLSCGYRFENMNLYEDYSEATISLWNRVFKYI